MQHSTKAAQLVDELGYTRLWFTGRISPSPAPSLRPAMFILGSSDGGIHLASLLGVGFAFAGQVNPRAAVPVLRAYRKNFSPTAFFR